MFAGVLATVAVLGASIVGNVIGGIGCIGSPHGRLLEYCAETEEGKVSVREALVFLVPPLLIAVAGHMSVRRRECRAAGRGDRPDGALALVLPLLLWD